MTTEDHRGDASDARALLHEHFNEEIDNLRPLAGGVFSRAFAFRADGRELVLRINSAAHAAEGFAKDAYAARHFASAALPIPRVLVTGATPDGQTHFAISERVPGRTLQERAPSERRSALPGLLDTVEAIAHADTSASHGYGEWGGDGAGRFPRWHDYLAAIIDNEPDGYYRNWHALFHDSFLERDIYDTVYRQMLRLAVHCPEERVLIHNDFWFENVLSEGERITGVIDWANALYGDPLYEVARLSWGAAWPGWWYDDGVMLLRERFGSAPGYAERLACYQCHIGLDDLRFYANTRRRTEYDFFRARLLTLIATQQA